HMHTFLQQGNDFPTPGEIASLLTITEADTTQHIRKLMQKDMLEIKELSVDNKWTEAYSLEPLWEKLFAEKQPQTNDKAEEHEGTIFILFEQEFARPLSPFEIETINIWLDEENMKTELIKAALRESVLMGKLNFKYIDRILREWKHKGIHYVDEGRRIMLTKKEIRFCLDEMEQMFPNAHCELTHENPFELLIAVLLSAQTTDINVNRVTDDLFRKYKEPEDYLDVSLEELENDI